MEKLGGRTGLEPAASCVTGRGITRVNFDLLDGQGLISSPILCLLDMPSKRGGNISIHRFLRLFMPFIFIIFHVRNSFDSWGDTRCDRGSP